MPIQNLDQLRAKHALERKANVAQGDDEGNHVSGYPAMIIADGLLNALAVSVDKEDQRLRVANAIAHHLNAAGILTVTPPNAENLLKTLAGSDDYTLRRVTAESLAFLSFLKRFV
jgi:hypothetical protein